MQYVLILIGIYLVISFLYSKFKGISFLQGCVNVILGILNVLLSGGKSSIDKAEREVKKRANTPENAAKINQARAANAYATSTVNTIKNKADNYFDQKK